MNPVDAQDALYDESDLPEFELPDLLLDFSGKKVSTIKNWNETRRPEILAAFCENVFGTMPTDQHRVVITSKLNVDATHEFKIVPNDSGTVSGRVRELTLTLSATSSPGLSQNLSLLVITPSNSDGPCPAFLAYNFLGNATVDPCPSIPLTKVWQSKERKRILLTEQKRGTRSNRWPVGLILSRGFSLVTLNYGDVDGDFDDSFRNGVHAFFPDLQNREDNWSSIGAWAWGLHRVMDYLELDPAVDTKNVIVFGHSRLGKTALWAGATDPRIAAVISNNSGCGGAALSRRRFGESVKRINTVFPHWFAKRHRKYNDNENECPVDHHMLIALMAPRSVYVASAEGDRWADPKGEFLATANAGPAFELFGKTPLIPTSQLSDSLELPSLEKPQGTDVRYHIRRGKHDVKRYDWTQYLDFAEYVIASQK